MEGEREGGKMERGKRWGGGRWRGEIIILCKHVHIYCKRAQSLFRRLHYQPVNLCLPTEKHTSCTHS